ncbi:hypothetical protein [Spirillospora albida]|uniref:hypothetical protein n=1 Tax=Spirillospora albida TaxID=58123 RepID=UPI00147052C6|nr:hypothetical protein [Spirillospora albida]
MRQMTVTDCHISFEKNASAIRFAVALSGESRQQAGAGGGEKPTQEATGPAAAGRHRTAERSGDPPAPSASHPLPS